MSENGQTVKTCLWFDTQAEIDRLWSALTAMKKFDLAGLEAAYRGEGDAR